MNSLTRERYSPYVLAAVGAGGWFLAGAPFPASLENFFTAALGLAGTLLGFLATAQAILMALPSDSVMGQLRSSGYIDVLVRYMREASYSLLAFAVLNLLGFFFVTKLPKWFPATWIVFSIVAGLTFHRVISIILRIMRRR